jgi:hypothetical protein
MEQQIIEISATREQLDGVNNSWIAALEAGKVLYFPNIGFTPTQAERRLFSPEVRDPKSRNISLDPKGVLKGGAGEADTQAALAAMIGRFQAQASAMLETLFPDYIKYLKQGPTSFRPMQVETRAQSWRADDRRLHVDAFPSRPNRGERLLRVFTNVNPEGQPRVWRVGQPFEEVAKRFLPQLKPYSAWQAKLMHGLGVTKSLRSEYDHLMLQLHDAMKSNPEYQEKAPQVTFGFPPGSTWICFSDQASHAVMSGQYMMEQTAQLPAARQYEPEASPLAILTRLKGHALI